MARVNLFLIHGFLGRPQDWMHLKRHLAVEPHIVCHMPDLFNNENLSPFHSFSEWAQNFTHWAQSFTGAQDRNILVGYSLGARLALHAFEKDPMYWDHAIFISGNPGFNDDSFDVNTHERQKRWLNDTYWADKFMKADWHRLILDWNSQGVFNGGGLEPQRDEKNYNREVLGLALTRWSLSLQRNMRSLIWREAKDITWVVGENDDKYRILADELKANHPELRVKVAPNSGHRVIFDSPQFLSDIIHKIIAEKRQSRF